MVQKKYFQNNIEIISLKSTNKTNNFKLVDSDISTIKIEDIIEKLSKPELHNVGNRIKYVF